MEPVAFLHAECGAEKKCILVTQAQNLLVQHDIPQNFHTISL